MVFSAAVHRIDMSCTEKLAAPKRGAVSSITLRYLAGDVAGGVGALGVQAQGAAAEGRQMRVVRRWADGHRARAAAEQVAQPADGPKSPDSG